jgi:DNA-binding transcriptional LysR family regulator
VPQILVASPSYIEKYGMPHDPRDLLRHNCLVHLLSAASNTWRFKSEDGAQSIVIDGSIKSELGEALRSAALLGRGISVHPSFMIADDLKAGRLVALLSDWSLPEMHIRAVYASNTHAPARVKSFLVFLKQWFYFGDKDGRKKPGTDPHK